MLEKLVKYCLFGESPVNHSDSGCMVTSFFKKLYFVLPNGDEKIKKKKKTRSHSKMGVRSPVLRKIFNDLDMC